jgi:hypothetical protein
MVQRTYCDAPHAGIEASDGPANHAGGQIVPLSSPAAREPMHTRRITLDGYMRDDGLMDVEAHLVDTKPYEFTTIDRGTVTPGVPLHEMWVRITVDDSMVIVAAEAVTEHGPFFNCGNGADSFARLVGVAIRPGFMKAANAPLAGVHGCTHIREMLQQVATVAMQTMWPVRSRREADAAAVARANGETTPMETARADGSARLINTCYAYSSERQVVQRRWPHLYTGPEKEAASAYAEASLPAE